MALTSGTSDAAASPPISIRGPLAPRPISYEAGGPRSSDVVQLGQHPPSAQLDKVDLRCAIRNVLGAAIPPRGDMPKHRVPL